MGPERTWRSLVRPLPWITVHQATLYYSYGTCGNQDSGWAATNSTKTTGAGCTINPKGAANCQCTTIVPPVTLITTCTAPNAVNKTCINATGGTPSSYSGWATKNGGLIYPPSFGQSCKKQMEPGFKACSDDAGTEWPTVCTSSSQTKCRASWCDDAWCYVDPCKCSAPDMKPSSLFKPQATNSTVSYGVQTVAVCDREVYATYMMSYVYIYIYMCVECLCV